MKLRFTLLLLTLTSLFILSFSGNPPNGNTGAPGEGTCASCHNPPSSTPLNGDMQITGLPNTITAGTSYTVTVTVNNPAMNANRAGFQMVALDETNSNSGTMSNPGFSSNIVTAGGRTYHEHAPAQTYGGSSSVSWTVDWLAPAAGTLMTGDSIFLYGSSIIANGSGSSSDILRLDELRVEFLNPVIPVEITVTNIIDPSCEGDSDGQATANPVNGMPPYVIAWDNGEIGTNATMLDAGMHSVTVTDANIATASVSFMVNDPAPIEITNIVTVDASCFDICNGTIEYDVSGGTGNYQFMWIGPDGFASSNQFLVGLCDGTYNLTITDMNGCTLSADFIIEQPEPIVSENAVVTNASCNGASDGGVNIFPTGGNGTLSINWDNGQTGTVLSNVPAGVYNATIVDINGCSLSAPYQITEPPVITVSISETVAIDCFGGLGSIVAASDANNPTYLWSNGVMTPNNDDITAGAYSVIVTDANMCTNESSYTIEEPDELTITFDVTPINQGNDGSIEANPIGGTSPYSYLWSNDSTNNLITNLGVGNYVVTVTDDNGCTAIDLVTLSSNCDLIFDSINGTDLNCFESADGTATIAVEGRINTSLDITWSNGDTTLTTDSLSAGIYTVTISDGGMCQIDTSITINQPDPLLVLLDATPPSSDLSGDGQITANATGGNQNSTVYTYAWETGEETQTISDLNPGDYQLTVTDEAGCTGTAQVSLEVFTCDYEIQVITTEISCPGSADANAFAVISGNSTPDLTWSTGEMQDTIENLDSGDYFLAAVDSAGCADTVLFSIAINDKTINLLDTIQTNITCQDTFGQVTIFVDQVDMPYSYLWTNGDTTSTADSLPAGLVSVVVTNGSGCSDSFVFTITEDFSAEIILELQDIEIFLDADGIFEDTMALDLAIVQLMGGCEDSLYLEYTPGLFTCSEIGLNTVYTTLFNNGMEIGVDSFVATVLDTTPPVIMCPDTMNLTENLIACGGLSIFGTIPISGESIQDNCTTFPDTTISFVFIITETGYYNFPISIADECGNVGMCNIVGYAEIFEQPQMEAILTDATCFGATDGCIDVVVTGGTPPYDITPNLCDIGAGTYTVTLEDANGCLIEDEYAINQPTEIIISIDDFGGETPGESDGFVDVSVIGGVPPYEFSWTENGLEVSTLEDLINFPTSQYKLTVTDSLGCAITLNTFIDVFDNIGEYSFGNLNIYPNPFTSDIIVEGLGSEQVEISIFDVAGRQIPITMTVSDDKRVLSTENIVDGIYFISISDGVQTVNRKLIKTK